MTAAMTYQAQSWDQPAYCIAELNVSICWLTWALNLPGPTEVGAQRLEPAQRSLQLQGILCVSP